MNDAEHEVRVLVVDDSQDAANGLTAVLSSAHYAARAVYDGRSALAVAAAFQPQVVLLDIDMPVMDGYETAARLHQLEFDKRPLLIALTGQSDVASVNATANAGFDLHISKPCEVSHLLELLKRTISVRLGLAKRH